MNKDITPSLENNQAWWHARNIANNSEDGDLGVIGNEPANLSCGVIPYTVIGAIHRYGDEWIVYSTDDVSSEIGRFDDSECKYETIVNDPCLNFSRKFLITGAVSLIPSAIFGVGAIAIGAILMNLFLVLSALSRIQQQNALYNAAKWRRRRR